MLFLFNDLYIEIMLTENSLMNLVEALEIRTRNSFLVIFLPNNKFKYY